MGKRAPVSIKVFAQKTPQIFSTISNCLDTCLVYKGGVKIGYTSKIGTYTPLFVNRGVSFYFRYGREVLKGFKMGKEGVG